MALDPRSLPIDAEELQRRIEALGEMGNHPQSGRWLALYTPAWEQGMALVRGWMEEAGLQVRQDAVGNLFGRLDGREEGPAILTGSHIDTVPNGGRYDGQLGVHAALTAVAALKRSQGQPRRSIEVTVICDEEGSRFISDYVGSRAIAGFVKPEELEGNRDADGVTMAEGMRRVGLDPARLAEARRDDVAAWLELHIEQGGTLEAEGLDIGVVHTITGMRQQRLRVEARQDHAGVTPMDVRVDGMAAVAEMIANGLATARRLGRPAVCTTGFINAEPGDPSVVPGVITFTQDMRDAEAARYRELTESIGRFNQEAAARWGATLHAETLSDHAPIAMDRAQQAVLQEEAARAGYRWKSMPSMAGHDAEIMVERWPSAMLFVPSHDGRSHTPAELTPIEQVVPGVQVLAAALHRLAY
jgi:allantoate deiminase